MAENKDQEAQGTVQISNRERVRQVLISPLTEWGMVRPKRMTQAEFAAMQGRLAEKLAYMTDANLRGLLELVTRHAAGPDRNCWPAEVSIYSWAGGLQQRPARENDYVKSLMRSAMGRNARALGYHVELFLLARKVGPPPSKYELNRLLDRSTTAQRKRAKVEQQVARGTAALDDAKWLSWYSAAEAACLSIMDEQDQQEGKAA